MQFDKMQNQDFFWMLSSRMTDYLLQLPQNTMSKSIRPFRIAIY